MKKLILVITLVTSIATICLGERIIEKDLNRPIHTYSIVARDPDNGQLGVAVQSHWFSVGPLVPWVEAGVGAVATQSFSILSFK